MVPPRTLTRPQRAACGPRAAFAHEFQLRTRPRSHTAVCPSALSPRRVVHFDGQDDALLLPFMADVAAVSLWLRLELPEDTSPLPDTHTLLHLQAPAALVGSDAVGALWSVFYVDGEPVALPGASAPTPEPLSLSPTHSVPVSAPPPQRTKGCVSARFSSPPSEASEQAARGDCWTTTRTTWACSRRRRCGRRYPARGGVMYTRRCELTQLHDSCAGFYFPPPITSQRGGHGVPPLDPHEDVSRGRCCICCDPPSLNSNVRSSARAPRRRGRRRAERWR